MRKNTRCACCKRIVGLDKDGKFYNHGPGPGDMFFCPGGLLKPAQVRVAAKRLAEVVARVRKEG